MDRSFTKTLDSYLATSSAWLMDCMRAHDLASAGAGLVDAGCVASSATMPRVEDGPFFSHHDTTGLLSYNVPVHLFTGTEFIRAMYLIRDGELSSTEKMHVPGLGNARRRVEAIICRSGMIAQFELWKKFAKERNYPTDWPAAERHRDKGRMSAQEEIDMLEEVIKRRNVMTHEPDPDNDPDARELVDYTNKIQHVAKWVNTLHKNGHTASWDARTIKQGKRID